MRDARRLYPIVALGKQQLNRKPRGKKGWYEVVELCCEVTIGCGPRCAATRWRRRRRGQGGAGEVGELHHDERRGLGDRRADLWAADKLCWTGRRGSAAAVGDVDARVIDWLHDRSAIRRCCARFVGAFQEESLL